MRTFGDPASIISQVEHLIFAIAPDLPVFDVRTMTQALNSLNGMLRFQLGAGLATVLGMVGLVLSVVGVYGVISYPTSQRTQEIGIRVAMGARQIDIQWMVLRHGMVIVTGGLALGLACAYAGGRLVGQFLVISPTDPVVYLAVSSLLTVTALAACDIPARRITRVDPLAALRCQ